MEKTRGFFLSADHKTKKGIAGDFASVSRVQIPHAAPPSSYALSVSLFEL